MKIKKLFFAFIIFIFCGFCFNVSAFNVGEYVYYDPYNHKSCDINDYWTIYNQESTCYRWVIIQTGIEKQSQDVIRLFLDHDIGVSNFNDRTTIHKNVKQTWNDPNIVDINTLGNNMVLSLYKGNYEKNSEWDKSNPTKTNYLKKLKSRNLSFVYTNTLFYYNGKVYYDYNRINNLENSITNSGGYWISHSDSNNDPFLDPKTITDNELAYYVTSNGHIKLSSTEDIRGVRPTIYINESALLNASYESSKIELTQEIANGGASNLNINYVHEDSENNVSHKHDFILRENTYFYPQGFAFYENTFLVYMMHRTKTENGIKYEDTTAPGILLQHNTKNGFSYKGNYELGHGNDISILSNESNKKFYINNSKDGNIFSFDLNTFEKQQSLQDSNGEFYYGAFTLDSSGKYLYGVDSDMRIVVRDAKNKYKKMYTFDAPILETLQSVTYNNGYLYIATYEVPKIDGNKCNDGYQLYCYGDDSLTTVYVYNVKFDSNGKPTRFFGKLVKKYITNNINKNEENLHYEIESIGSIEENLFFGYARSNAEKIVVPIVYKYDQPHSHLVYVKKNEDVRENIISDTYIDIQTPFEYKDNEVFFGWTMDNNKEIINNTTMKIDKNITLFSIYAEFENGSLIKENLLKYGLNKDINDFNSKNFCYGCEFKILGDKNFISTGDEIQIYLGDNKLKEYKAVVKGDVTGTGTSTVSDVAKLYQYLKKKIDMEDCYKEAGNVVGNDNEIKINDVAKLYQFIKKKISSLED